MRKIIITLIATIVMISPFEGANGQRLTNETNITSAYFPTVNVLTGVNARLSIRLWRFEPFVQFGAFLQMFEERMAEEWWCERCWEGADYWVREEYHLPRFANKLITNIGTDFRITDSDRIRIGVRTEEITGIARPYLGYVRRQVLSQRISADLFLYTTIPFTDGGSAVFGFLYNAVTAGIRLNYEIVRNLKLNIELDYTKRYNIRHWSRTIALNNISGERLTTRNLIDFSIGIHYHIQFGGRPQQTPQRPPRQRVAPHQRALPCPPGQMRHLRSWDRPSSVFNHPTAR